MVSKKCTCNPLMAILALILLSVAMYLLVMGFTTQFNGGGSMWAILGWYFVGLIVLTVGKICKWKGHMSSCPVHGDMK